MPREEAARWPGILHQWHSSLPSKPSKPGFEGFGGCRSMTLSWISRRNRDSVEPVDLILPVCLRAAHPQDQPRRSSKSSSPCTTLHASWARRGPPRRYSRVRRVDFDSITSSARSKTADNRCVEEDRDQGRDAGATARDGGSRAARRPDRWSRGRGPSAWRLQGYWPRTLGPQRPY